jgi:hypothetical protein
MMFAFGQMMTASPYAGYQAVPPCEQPFDTSNNPLIYSNSLENYPIPF